MVYVESPKKLRLYQLVKKRERESKIIVDMWREYK